MTSLHYSEILSVSDGRLVAHNHMEGVYNACDALAGPGCTTIALSYLAAPLKAHLRKLFPVLDKPEVAEAITAAVTKYKKPVRWIR